MNTLKNTVVIHDNELTNDLRLKCKKTIEIVKNLSLEERRLHYEELNLLLKELLDNKNKNFKDFTKKIIDLPVFDSVEIASILDRETEEYIEEIFNILTNKLD